MKSFRGPPSSDTFRTCETSIIQSGEKCRPTELASSSCWLCLAPPGFFLLFLTPPGSRGWTQFPKRVSEGLPAGGAPGRPTDPGGSGDPGGHGGPRTQGLGFLLSGWPGYGQIIAWALIGSHSNLQERFRPLGAPVGSPGCSWSSGAPPRSSQLRVSFLFGSQEEPGSQQDPGGARRTISSYFCLFSFGFRWSDRAGFV